MSHQTPRQKRHARHPSSLIPALSDYESDATAATAAAAAAAAAAVQASYPAPPPRTNTELNLSVLQRYLPSIQSILSIAANAVVYTFDSTSSSWDKSGVEGTMFVCAQAPLSENSQPRACVFVLNRRALDNLVVDLARVSHVEIADELVIVKVDANGHEGDKVIGLWIHNDKDETREVNGAAIQECWKAARLSGAGEDQRPAVGSEAGPAMHAIGRSLSVRDLFAEQRQGGQTVD